MTSTIRTTEMEQVRDDRDVARNGSERGEAQSRKSSLLSFLSKASNPNGKCQKQNSNTQVSVAAGEIEDEDRRPPQQGDAFTSDGGGGGIDYKTNDWWQIGALMTAEIISLGILSLPRAVRVLGLVPGVISLVGFGLLSLYAGVVYGDFKIAYPRVTNISQAGGVLFGRTGTIMFGASSVTVLIFITAAHIGSFSIALNVLTGHGTCSIVFAVVATIISIACSLPKRLEEMSYLSVVSCVSIFSAVLVCIGSIAHDRPEVGHMQLFGSPDFAEGMTAILNIVLAYAGHVTFFGFIAEMKEPKDFKKSLVLMEISAMSAYIVFAVVVYYYAGSGVLAPALSSASPLARKIAYGLALPTIVVSGVINGHLACKTVWIAIWRKQQNVLTERSWRSSGSWFAITMVAYVLAWVIAEGIPDFHQLLALVSALFMGFFSYGVTSLFWLKMNWKRKFSTTRLTFLTVGNVIFLLVGLLICGCGLAASGINISGGLGGTAFSCADNSTPDAQGH